MLGSALTTFLDFFTARSFAFPLFAIVFFISLLAPADGDGAQHLLLQRPGRIALAQC
ncbi:hypothetical protein D3C86_2266370 [compost metagenome]